jgi:hypothetical protein
VKSARIVANIFYDKEMFFYLMGWASPVAKKARMWYKVKRVLGAKVTTGQKTAVSLLISVVLIAGFSVAAFSKLFAIIETRFYQPVVLKDIEQRIEKISSELNEYVYIHISRFSAFATLRGIQNGFETAQSDEDIKQREDVSGAVLAETAGLLGIRLVDSNGRRIHFSTFPDDKQRYGQNEIAYNNYTSFGELDYEQVRAIDTQDYNLFFDKRGNRLIFSFPVFDRRRAYRGSLLYYLDADDFSRYLAARNSINITDFPRLAVGDVAPNERQDSRARGFVFGALGSMRDVLVREVETQWQQTFSGIERIASIQDTVWVAVSNSRSVFGSVIWLYPEDVFMLSLPVRLILLASIFITVYLIIFLIFGARRDSMGVVRQRIKHFQISFIKEYFDTKEQIEWDKFSNEIAFRKFDVSAEIRRSLGKPALKHKAAVDALLEKSWDEILAVLGKKSEERRAASGETSTDEIKAMLQQIITSGAINVQAAHTGEKSSIKSVDQIEEFNEADVLGEVLDLDDSEAVEVNELDEYVEVEELTAADEDEAAAIAEEPDEVEELATIETVEEIWKIDEDEKILESDIALRQARRGEHTPSESADEIGTLEEITPLDEIDDIGLMTEIEQAIEKETVEEVALLDETEELGSLAEIEPRHEIEPLAEAEHAIEPEVEEEAALLDETQELASPVETESPREIEPLTETEQAIHPETSSAVHSASYPRKEIKEELRIGLPHETGDAYLDVDFEVFKPDFSFIDDIDEFADDESVYDAQTGDPNAVYDVVELAPRDDMICNLFNSGALFGETETLETEMDNVIVEDDGLYLIPQNASLSSVAQDPAFKTLVDSVLK